MTDVVAAKVSDEREKTVDILDSLFWSVQPPNGLVKGHYYRAENHFAPHFEGDPGYTGILEVVRRDGRLVMVEFNELNAPTYYIKKYQGVSKRLSDYGFFQAGKERTAKTGVVLVNGITHVEEQMLRENRLSGEFDLLTGASNSVKRSMLLLAKEISARLDAPSGQLYYGLARPVEAGVCGRLQLVVEAGRLVRCFYDEIFADTPQEIGNPELQGYYRQSKYYAPEYISTSVCGFNVLSDMLEEKVLATGDLLDLSGLPFTGAGNRAAEWDHYLPLARELQAQMRADGVLP